MRAPNILALLLTSLACSHGGFVAPGTVAVSPSSATLAVGASQQFSATEAGEDSTSQDASGRASWTVSDSSVATFDPATPGLLVGLAPGTVWVTATLNQRSGTAAVVVTGDAARSLTGLTLTPNPLSLAVGNSASLMALGTFSDGSQSDVTRTATWSSGTPSIATVDDTGLVTAQEPGGDVITAVVGAIFGTAQVMVPAPPPTLTSITIAPMMPSLVVGATQLFTATAHYSDGTQKPLVASTVTWNSDTPTVATVDVSGLVTAVGAGSAVISATYESMSDDSTLTVTSVPPVLMVLAVTPMPAEVVVGQTLALTATGSYSDGTMATLTTGVSWAVADAALVSVDANGILTGVMAGSTTVTATIGALTSDPDTLTVNAATTSTCSPVINEVQPGQSGAATNEFIELYNPCASAADMSNWSVQYFSSTGTTTTLKKFEPGTTLGAQAYLVLGYWQSGSGFTGHADFTYSAASLSGIGNAKASIGVTDSTGAVVDGLGYGGAVGGFVQGTAALYLGDTTPASSLARVTDGVTTHDNSYDFRVTVTPTPGAANNVNAPG